MLAPGTVASSPRSIRMGDICLSVENVLFDQDDYDVAGVWCVVCGHCCDQEGVASALTSIPTYTCTYAQSYVYLHNTPNPTYNIHSYLHLDLPTTPNSTCNSTIHRLPGTKEEYFGDSECATMID